MRGAADKPVSGVIVFDASGSMATPVGAARVAKSDMARDAVKQSLSQLRPGARLALIGFGHRRKGDCSDVELLAPLDPPGPERAMAALGRLGPRGKGPLALALREAAKVAGPSAPSSIIVVHDGDDNCQQDVCAAAAEIAKAYPRLRIHTVGLGLDPEEAKHTACIAKTTGGLALEAHDPASAAAALQMAFKRAGLVGVPAAHPAPPEPQPAGPDMAASSGPPRVRVAAHLGAVKEPIAVPIDWTVRAADGGKAVVLETTARELVTPLAPGTYEVTARLAFVSATAPLIIGAKGLTTAAVTLDAGILQIAAVQSQGLEPDDGMTLAVAPKDGSSGARWMGQGGQAELVLPRGDYRVTAAEGLARAEQTVAVSTGEAKTVEIALNAGRLELAAADPSGHPVGEGVIYTLAVDDPAAADGRREVARSAAAKPSFVVPTGTYYITARLGTAEARDRVAVGPGGAVERTLVLGFARLSLAAATTSGSVGETQPVTYRVVRLEGDGREVAQSTAPTPDFVLAAGRYRIDVQLGSQNAKASREIELKPGDDTKLSLNVDAGRFALHLADPAKAQGGDAYWEIKDAGDHAVWRTTRSAPEGFLAPGRYTVRFESRDRRAEQSFDIAAGDNKTIEVHLE